MKLRLLLTTFCLLGIGIFSHAQDKKKTAKPTVEDGVDPMPITVTSTKKSQKKPPPPPPQKAEVVKFAPPKIVKDGKSQPKVIDEKIVVPAKPAKNGDKPMPPPPPPKIVDDKKVVPAKPAKDGDKQIPPPPPPPKPAKEKAEKPVAPDAPPAPDERTL